MCSSKKASLAIEELGERVTGCDQQKAEASNAKYDKAVAQGYKPSNIMKSSRSDKGQNSHEATDSKSDNEQASMFEGVIDPIVGEVYQAFWDAEPRSWYLAVVLPYSGSGDWKEIGIRGNLFTSGLAEEIPSCFKVVKVAKDSEEKAPRLTWAKGYEDGGPHVRGRKFPCLFLHSPLEIPPADQELAIGHKVEVLAFRTAQQLRHRSTALPPTVCKDGVNAYQGLATDFEARLKTVRAIRAKQDPAPGKEVQDAIGGGASSIHDQQQADNIISVRATEDPSLPVDFHVGADLLGHNIRDRLTKTENGQGELSDHSGLAHRNPRVSLPSYDVNSFIGIYGSSNGDNVNQTADRNAYYAPMPLSRSTPGLCVAHGGEAGPSKAKFLPSKAASREEQPKEMMKQQGTWPYGWQITSSTNQTAARPSTSAEAPSSASAFATPAMGGGKPVQGVISLSKDSRHTFDSAQHSGVSKRSKISPSLHGRIDKDELNSRPLKAFRQGTVDQSTREHPQGQQASTLGNDSPIGARGKASVSRPSTLAGKPRGPTALLPTFQFRNENARHGGGLPGQDKVLSLGKAGGPVGSDAAVNSAGEASWSTSYSQMLREPWRSADQRETAGKGPENP